MSALSKIVKLLKIYNESSFQSLLLEKKFVALVTSDLSEAGHQAMIRYVNLWKESSNQLSLSSIRMALILLDGRTLDVVYDWIKEVGMECIYLEGDTRIHIGVSPKFFWVKDGRIVNWKSVSRCDLDSFCSETVSILN